MNSIARRMALMTVALAAAGCGISRPTPLVPSQFVRSRPAVGPDPIGQPVGQSGALAYGELHAPLLPDEYTNTNPKPAPGISPLVQRDVHTPGQGPVGPTTQESTEPATTAPANSAEPGPATSYQVVGTVVATVDGTPIFADKILASLDHELAAEAHKFGPAMFRQAARQDITSRIQAEEHAQLEIEHATHTLSSDSKNEAHLYTQVWRSQQITAAGGSEAVARQRALENGESFDDLVRDQYNNALVQLYFQQFIIPKIQVTPGDMRRYYLEHLDTEFTKHAEAKFSLIRVDFARSGGPEQAAEKARRIIDDLKAGANFAEEARKYNDDAYLKTKGGDMGWMRKGAGFKFQDVEDAVWKLQPGQFTDTPVQVNDPSSGSAYYIAELDAKRGGAVQPFDSPIVQNAIHEKLFSSQMQVLREKDLVGLINQAVILDNPNGVDTAVDMAMQRYPVWASAR